MDRWELIEKKIQNRLSEQEKAEFEKLRKEDGTFDEEVREHENIAQILSDSKRLQEIDAFFIRKKGEKHKGGIFRKFIIYGSMAASILLFSYFSFTDVYRPDISIDSGVVMRIEENKDAQALTPEQKKALENFLEGQYNMNSGEYLKAIESFKEVLKVTNIRQYFKEATIWHLCIAHLKAGQFVEAKKRIDEISSWQSPKYTFSKIDRWKLSWQIYLKNIFE